MIKTKKTIIGLMILSSLQSFAQDRITNFAKEDLLSDFDLMVNIIKKQHPNPFKFIEEKKFNSKVDSLRKILMANPDIRHFAACRPIQLIHDAHIASSLFNDVKLQVLKSLNYFPYSIFVERGRAFVNNTGLNIPYGSEIIEINNVPITEILKELSAYVDGNIKTGTDYNSKPFSVAYALKYPQVSNFQISFIKHGETKPQKIVENAISLTNITYRDQRGVFPFNVLQLTHSVYSELNNEKSVGVLTVNTFAISENVAYKEFSQFFKEVNDRKYKEVIIDVRRNSGGDPAIAALLYSFIAKSSFSNVYTYKTKNIKLNYAEYLIDNQSRKLSQDDVRGHDDFMYQRFNKDDSTGWYVGNTRLMEGLITNFPKDKDAFSGTVKVLIGTETISAATYFASLVKMNNRGVIIGKETGSGLDATTAAWFATYELPHTKSTLTIPLSEIYFFDAKIDRGRGLLPDKEVPIELFLKYMSEMKDPEMTYALENN